MFDDVSPKNPNEPEDIFAGSAEIPASGPLEVKSALANNKLKPVDFSANQPNPVAGPKIEISQPLLSKKGLFVAIGIILIVGLGGLTAWGVWRTSKKATPQNTSPIVNSVNEESKQQPASAENIIPPENVPVVESTTTPAVVEETPAPAIVVADTDGDGLNDDDETKYGTDAQKTDTDGDTLTDYEELMIWKTDPLVIDTDGDSYDDGTEVKNGFNPLGSGKLLELPIE